MSTSAAERIVLSVNDALQVYPITATTIILRQGQQVAATAILPGDQAEVQYDAQGNATVIRATFGTVEGKVVAKVPNQLLLEGRNDLFVVQPQAVVTIFGTNAPAQYGDINNNDTVVLRVTPGTTKVWGIAIKRATTPAPTPTPATTKPVIERFYSDAAGPLRAGQTLHIIMEGTPGGTALCDIGTVRKALGLRELRGTPGRYVLDWVIPEGVNALGVPLIGNLLANGMAADPAQSAETITIDTVPPTVTIYGPAADQQTSSRQPNIAVMFADENGSGIDPETSTIELKSGANSLPVTLTRQGGLVTLAFDPLPLGPVSVTVTATDKAGNQTRVGLAFTVVAPAPTAAPLLSASHDAAGKALSPGDTLTVSATGPAGGTATFSIGQWQQNLPMAAVGDQPGTYRGTFTVPALAADREEEITVKLQPASGAALTATLTPKVVFARARALAPVILRPLPGSRVGQSVIVEGTTRPLVEVECTITWKGIVLGIFQQTGQVTKIALTADNQGHFQSEPISLNVSSVASAANITYTLTCKAQDGEETAAAAAINFAQ